MNKILKKFLIGMGFGIIIILTMFLICLVGIGCALVAQYLFPTIPDIVALGIACVVMLTILFGISYTLSVTD